jgi:hypothetical protein
MKRILSVFLLTIMFSGLLLAGNSFFGKAQTSTPVTGIIKADTTWTKANIPYILTGPVAIDKGVTLTIEPGVHIDFNSYYMQVNGTLIAKGNGNNPVSFLTAEGHTSEIIFMPSSKNWNEETSAGSIIENCNIPSNSFKITINGTSPKIASSISQALITINNGSPLIINNRFSGHISSIIINGGTPIISNNRLSDFRVVVEEGAPIIFSNTLVGSDRWSEGSFAGYSGTCIEALGGNSHISNNNIANCSTGILIGNGFVEKNTISNSAQDIIVKGSVSPIIRYNNILFSSQSVVLSEGANQNVDAANNWWGTTDEATISQSIFDNKNDFNLGAVTFTPFLDQPNQEAPKITDSTKPSATPETPEYPSLMIPALLAVAAFMLVAGYKKKAEPTKFCRSLSLRKT